ncbi:Crp/Fnr family transcriptional regulator [Chitinibacter fontanus]|uniref:Crp/Fnr family transcriptional regulator n=1 Tax=Chitinibacter fontanus TaxID=1737446 RepID=A0A7D5ZER3_9NEIS|nr:Crp/Fnr family transcriptional regulator [Chitinibacter fontanus]QLI81108.1 Crp/Fnr family transcriptional regulator [Chitinibacter fontanus]
MQAPTNSFRDSSQVMTSSADPMLPLLFPLLQAFPAPLRATLVAAGEEIDAPAGTQLWQEGQDITDIILLSSGIIIASANPNAGSREFLYGHMSAGAVAGLHALMMPSHAQVQLIVRQDAHYLRLPLSAVRAALTAHPAAWEAVAHELAQGVFHLMNMINLLGHSNGYQRLRRLLIQMDRRAKNEHLPSGLILNQQEIAARIGLSREMVNRMLSQLRSGGYIEQDERGILQILQPLPREF